MTVDSHDATSSARPPSRPRRLLFAFAPPAHTWATAFLRGHQVMEIISRLGAEIECHAAKLSDLKQLRNERIVLTKSALRVMTPDDVLELRRCGHRLAADFVDMKIDMELASLMHFLIASSMSQSGFFKARLPGVPTSHVTHHVDLRIPPIAAPRGLARFGYFGMPHNCLHREALTDLVRFVSVCHPLDIRWISRLAESNAHYALRSGDPQDGFKPFTKGFIAAHCAAPIVIAEDDEEARYYLGADYPFRIRDLSLASVRGQIRNFAGEYMSPSWKLAVDAMKDVAARSSRHHVEAELRVVLGAL